MLLNALSDTLRSPEVTLVASRRQVTLSATLALRITRTVWQPRSDHLCPSPLGWSPIRAFRIVPSTTPMGTPFP